MWSGTSFVVLICFALILSEEEEEKGASEDEMTGWHHWWKWTWTWEDFRRWWGTGRPDALQSLGSQRVGLDAATKQQQYLVMLSIFSCVCWPSVCHLWRNVYIDLPPSFLDWVCFSVLSYMSCLYILEINLLSIASFANIFSHSEGCLFILLIVSFATQKLLSPLCLFLFSLL